MVSGSPQKIHEESPLHPLSHKLSLVRILFCKDIQIFFFFEFQRDFKLQTDLVKEQETSQNLTSYT